MHIIVKDSPRRADPKRPESYPGYEKAAALSQRRAPQMEFESEGARKDYERAISSNPSNLPGLPPFFPPLQLRSVIGSPWGREYTAEEQRKMVAARMKELSTGEVQIFCATCDRVTPHTIDMKGSFCMKCGNQKPYHH